MRVGAPDVSCEPKNGIAVSETWSFWDAEITNTNARPPSGLSDLHQSWMHVVFRISPARVRTKTRKPVTKKRAFLALGNLASWHATSSFVADHTHNLKNRFCSINANRRRSTGPSNERCCNKSPCKISVIDSIGWRARLACPNTYDQVLRRLAKRSEDLAKIGCIIMAERRPQDLRSWLIISE